jgi:hypothetical protein
MMQDCGNHDIGIGIAGRRQSVARMEGSRLVIRTRLIE